MSRIIIIITIVWINVMLATNVLYANVLIIEEEITNTMIGKETNTIKKMYFSENKALFQDRTIPYDILFDINVKKVFLIDNVNKEYTSLSIDEIKRLSGGALRLFSDDEISTEITDNKK
jgi:hypothetical protein